MALLPTVGRLAHRTSCARGYPVHRHGPTGGLGVTAIFAHRFDSPPNFTVAPLTAAKMGYRLFEFTDLRFMLVENNLAAPRSLYSPSPISCARYGDASRWARLLHDFRVAAAINLYGDIYAEGHISSLRES